MTGRPRRIDSATLSSGEIMSTAQSHLVALSSPINVRRLGERVGVGLAADAVLVAGPAGALIVLAPLDEDGVADSGLRLSHFLDERGVTPHVAERPVGIPKEKERLIAVLAPGDELLAAIAASE